jgi:hypothetical protein
VVGPKEISLPITLHWWEVRTAWKALFLLFPWWLFGYHQILIYPDDQSKTTFTCPYGTYAYLQMSSDLCNAPVSFQRCMMSIFLWYDQRNHGSLHGWFPHLR